MKSRGFYNSGQSIQFLFTMVLLFSLVISAVFTILFGAQVYQNIQDRMDENFGGTTALSYISNKVKQSDKAGMISVENIEGTPVLKLVEQYDSGDYSTLIYCQDGQLKELFSSEDSGLSLADGMDIMKLKDLNLEMVGEQLLRIETQEVGGEYLLLSLRSQEEAYE
ncbi:DUF4860 domain-containing protein [Aminipila butyrica]|uniref:DUF4860 domain-containing protein n=1 Tax=Aminipila butyrica TaxID=433296 RepID=A0A858BRF1_9FIRM|nr:DUF4860 domain-containing protein [Aminipila butyrica]QIB68501.1 DUF4860 domain-containing protein [Aminipila butyrica]